MNPDRLYPRFAREALEAALSDWPVVLVQGPRQCGKSTLVQQVGQPLGYTYFTFDDPNLRQAAQVDPVGFVYHLPSRCILDEIQQAPQIVSSLKWVVDREPGRPISAHRLGQPVAGTPVVGVAGGSYGHCAAISPGPV